MFNVAKEVYLIDGKPFTAVVDFINDTIHIYGGQFSFKCPMDDYLDFEGCMKDFVTHKILHCLLG